MGFIDEGGHLVNSRFLKSFLPLAFLLFGLSSMAFAQLPQPGLPNPQAGPSAQSGSSSGTSSGGSAQYPAGPQTQSNFSGSLPGKFIPGVLPITLDGAIERGLKQNLGALLSSQDVQAAHGTRWQELSALLPHLTATPLVNVSQVNLREFGLNFTIPGANVPSIVGPFSYFDARAYLSQQLFDWKAINKTRSATESLKSAEYTYKDARDLVVLAVGFNYLQAIADEARIETAAAQVKTAQALYDQANDRFNAGTSPAIDALRAKVELQTREQQLIQARNDLAIQKLTVARVIGLAPGQQFDMTDKSPYAPLEGVTVEEALARAYANRSDYQAALRGVRAMEFSRKAAVAGYYPSLSFDADYGIAGQHLSSNHGVFDVRGTLNIPIFQGGSVHGDVLKADAQLQQSRERVENLRGQIDADVRTSLFNLQSSADQVAVARSNIDLAAQTLTQSIDRFAAGVTDTVEVVQSQEAVASANEQYISSLYNFNYAKISLARSVGQAEEGVKQYFKGK
jgi:outer membrane protein TolC